MFYPKPPRSLISSYENYVQPEEKPSTSSNVHPILKRCLTEPLLNAVEPARDGPPSPKKPKLALVRPKFDVKYADHLVHIGNARYLLYGETEEKPVVRVQECDYRVSHGGEKKEAKMIRFTLQQWMDLTAAIPAVNEAIEEFDDIKIHIGNNTFIRVQPQRFRVDIRDYFIPPTDKCNRGLGPGEFEPYLIPTRRGISLTYSEWAKLSGKGVHLLREGSDAIKGATTGSCLAWHEENIEVLKCAHCNPNGYNMW